MNPFCHPTRKTSSPNSCTIQYDILLEDVWTLAVSTLCVTCSRGCGHQSMGPSS